MWNFDVFKQMIGTHFDMDVENMDLNTELRDLGIDSEDFIEFLLDKEEEIVGHGVDLVDRSVLRNEVRDSKSLSEIFSMIG